VSSRNLQECEEMGCLRSYLRSGVRLQEDFRDNLIVARYDRAFLGMRGSKLDQLRSENSEDALTWNVFRSLEMVDPSRWFRALFERTFGQAFPHAGDTVAVDLWRNVSPPPSNQRQYDDQEVSPLLGALLRGRMPVASGGCNRKR
jgi:hypothetical protein